jgi:tRNA G18 (ribose-2'-O)-methylase SpoU
MPKTAKYPVEKRGASYQRYLGKLRRRSKWKKRARRPKREKAAPILVVEKKTKRVLVKKEKLPTSMRELAAAVSKPAKHKDFKKWRLEKPKPISVVKRATMKEIATMRRAMGISASKARRLLRMAQRTAQPEYKPKRKKKIWLPKTIQRGLR